MSSGHKRPLAALYVKVLDSYGGKYVVLLFWICFCLLGIWFGPMQFLARTTTAFIPPSSTLAWKADKLLGELFPQLENESDFALFVWNSEDESVVGTGLQQLTSHLNTSVYDYKPSSPGFVINFYSYYTCLDEGLPPASCDALISDDNTSTIFSISIDDPYTSDDAVDFATHVQDSIESFGPSQYNLQTSLTGIPAFLPYIIASTEHDMGLMDGIVMPVAILVLAFVLKSLRLLVIPLVVIGVSALSSFIAMYFVTYFMSVLSTAPSLMSTILIAMSIDYSLFLFSRYREELLRGRDVLPTVEIVMSFAGRTILVSGATLAVCFFGLGAFPLDLIRSTGIAAAVALLSTLSVNLTLVPSFLLIFKEFFRRSVDPFHVPCSSFVIRWGSWDDGRYKSGVDVPSAHQNIQSPHAKEQDDVSVNTPPTARIQPQYEDDPLLPRKNEMAGEIAPPEPGTAERRLTMKTRKAMEKTAMMRSFWYRSGRKMMKYPWNIVIIVVAIGLTIPFNLYAINYPKTDAMSYALPRGVSVTDAYLKMGDDFGYGTLYPYRLLMVPPPGQDTVMSDSFFTIGQAVLANLSTVENTSPKDISSVVYSNGTEIPFDVVTACLNTTSVTGSLITHAAAATASAALVAMPDDLNICDLVMYAYDQFVNANQSAMYAMITLDIDPLGAESPQWLSDARQVLADAEAKYNCTLLLAGVGSDSMDSVSVVYEAFPYIIGGSALVVLVFVAINFRSLLIPIRSVLTIAITMTFVFGFVTLTYVHGILNWTQVPGLQEQGAVYWLPPIIAFSIIVGIGLDYDIFLLARIREFRTKGYNTADSIVLGLTKTGVTITAAGLIMSISFSGLLASRIPMLNQLSLFMCVAVLFDTFVVRTLMVPSIMGIFGEANWWPWRTPPVTKHMPDVAPIAIDGLVSDDEEKHLSIGKYLVGNNQH
eukprot:TRINITY_DN8827_c0_g1_i1.p1 TRINITY_DN8827_c0_g1~~TRINITY_DN8827_c0_g1_i1.p1  ORF type:complete len:933 (-),score=199.36 TRINITY_DN8827_c0_g1_i1:20-2818(-)